MPKQKATWWNIYWALWESGNAGFKKFVSPVITKLTLYIYFTNTYGRGLVCLSHNVKLGYYAWPGSFAGVFGLARWQPQRQEDSHFFCGLPSLLFIHLSLKLALYRACTLRPPKYLDWTAPELSHTGRLWPPNQYWLSACAGWRPLTSWPAARWLQAPPRIPPPLIAWRWYFMLKSHIIDRNR